MRVTIEIPGGAGAPPVYAPGALEPGQAGAEREIALDAGAAPAAVMAEPGLAGAEITESPAASAGATVGEPSALDAGPPAPALIASLGGGSEAGAPGPAGPETPATRAMRESPTRQPPGFPVGVVGQPENGVRLEVFQDETGHMRIRSLPG